VSVFDWNDEKNESLKSVRGVSFEEVVFHIQNGDVLDVLKHPNAARYPNQNIIVLNVEGYVYLVTSVKERGVRFRWNMAVESLVAEGGSIAHVRCVNEEHRKEILRADAYVVALGSYSTRMLAPLGLRLPVYPVKGYSITVPIVDAGKAPESTIMDETHKVAVTRLGDRIRVGGTA
jgi:glycerol-3-phosphate dehydrogenase